MNNQVKTYNPLIILFLTIISSFFLTIFILFILNDCELIKTLFSLIFGTMHCDGFECIGPALIMFTGNLIIILLLYTILTVTFFKFLKRKNISKSNRIITTIIAFILMLSICFILVFKMGLINGYLGIKNTIKCWFYTGKVGSHQAYVCSEDKSLFSGPLQDPF